MVITIQKIIGCFGAALVGVGVTGGNISLYALCIVIGAAVYGLASC